MVGEDREAVLATYEARFRAAGLVSFCRRPHLRPTTALLFLAAAVVAVEAVYYLPLPDGGRILGLLLAAAAAGGAGIVLRHLEHRVERPAARGLAEGGFVLAPAAIAGIVGNWGDAFEVGVLNAALLAGYGLEERLGARFVLAWAVRFAATHLRAGWRSLYRAVPLLTVVLLALFFAAETWQVAARASWATLSILGALLAAGTMLLGGLSLTDLTDGSRDELRETERWNIAALAAVATGTLSTMAAGAFAILLSILGALLMPQAVVESWTGAADGGIYLTGAVSVGFGVALGKTVLLISAIAAFVCSATLGSSEAYRALSAEALRDEIDGLLHERERYLALVAETASESFVE